MKTDVDGGGLFLQLLLELYVSHACRSGLLFSHLQNEHNEQRLTKHRHAKPGRGPTQGTKVQQAYNGLSHGEAPRELDVG